MTSYHYATPPKGYTPFYGDSTSPTSPYNPQYMYYAPQQHYATATGHANTKHTRSKSYSQNATPQQAGGWHSPPGYPSPQFYGPNYSVPPQKAAYVSTAKDIKKKLRSFSMSGGNLQYQPTRSQKQRVYVDVVDEAHDRRQNLHREPSARSRRRSHVTDEYVFANQDQQFQHESPKRSRARRSSNANATATPQKSAKPHAPAKATDEDAIAAGIPVGYSTKNWDPEEQPLILLGSVFDANSLGKWIYDWTIFRFGASTPMADMAGDLWLLMIKTAGKMKRAEDCFRRVRGAEAQDLIEDFLTGGDRLWDKFRELMKTCEQFMWRAARRSGGKGVSMSKNAGTEFVESLLGRDRELQHTEDLMASIRLWNMRFDANLEDIIRRPSLA